MSSRLNVGIGGSGVGSLGLAVGGGEALQLVSAMMRVRVSVRRVGADLLAVRFKLKLDKR